MKVKFAEPGFLNQLNKQADGKIFGELSDALSFEDYKETSFFKFGELVDGALAVGANGDWKYVHGHSALNAWQFDKVSVAEQKQRLENLKSAYDSVYTELKDQLADASSSENAKISAKQALDSAANGVPLDDVLETLRGDKNFSLYKNAEGKASILFSPTLATGLSARLLDLGDGSAVIDAVSLALIGHGLVEMGVFSSSTSLTSMARALANSNILPKALHLVDDIAIEIGKEAVITGVATMLGVGLLWKGYEIYESLDGLKGTLEWVGQHSDNETIAYLNETVKKIESWFGLDGHAKPEFVPEYQELANLLTVAFEDFPQTLATIGFAVQEHLRAQGDKSWLLFADNDVEGALFHLQEYVDKNGGSLQSELQTALFNSDDLSVLEKVNLFPDRCFPKGTLISMWDGSQKPIEEITVSDQVLAFDAEGNRQPGAVTHLFRNTTQEWLQLSFEDERAPLMVTPGHRFLTETGDYLEIGQMARLGGGSARIVQEDGSIVSAQAESVVYSSATAHLLEQVEYQAAAGSSVSHAASGWQTYNFEVSTHHNYVADGIRVHNDSIFAYLRPEERPYVKDYKDLNGDDFPDFVVVQVPGTTIEKEKYLVAGRVVEELTTTDKDGNLIYVRRELDKDGNVVKGTEVIKQLTGAQAGESIGKSLTPFLARAIVGDDASLFERVATDTVLNTLLGNLGEFLGGTVHRGVLDVGELDLVENAETIAGSAFDDLGGDFVVAGANAAISVVNQLIMAEIFSDVAGDGVGGEVFEAVVGSGLDILLTEGVDLLFETDVFLNLFQDIGLSADSIKTIQSIGDINPVSMVMTAVINAVLPDLETIEGQIASTVTSIAITAFAILTQTFSAFTGPIAAVLSFIVGSFFDSLFEKHPRAFTHVGFDAETGQYVILDTWSKDGGNKGLSKDLAQAYVDSMNNFVDLVKAESHNFDELGRWSFGHYESALKNAGSSGKNFTDFQSTYLDALVQDMAEAQINDGQRAAVRALESVGIEEYLKIRTEPGFKDLYILTTGQPFGIYGNQYYNKNKSFQQNTQIMIDEFHELISGIMMGLYGEGNPNAAIPFMKAVVDILTITENNTIATFEEVLELHGFPSPALSDSELTQMVLSRMQIADDYHKYLENRETINTLIAAEPESAFAAGWMATFIAAKDLGLDDPYILDGDEIDNVFYTADGDDVIDGKSGDDLIKTYGGDDVLKGGTGDDTLIGGIGDDRLEGGADNDTYVFAGSFGKDVVIDSSGSLDTIRFEGTITLSDLKFIKDGVDLLVYKLDHDNPETALDELSNVLRIKDWQSSIERFEFTDGSIKGRLALLSEGNDTFTGTSSDDLIMGLGGNDTLNAGSGNDTLVGGAGNDQLKGGSGNDTYVFSRGFGKDTLTETSGTDTLRFEDGITLADLKIVADAGDLKFYLLDPAKPNQALGDITDVLTIKNWSANKPHIERFEFADGTVLSEILLQVSDYKHLKLTGDINGSHITGGNLSEFIHGSDQKDTLNAGGYHDQWWQELHGYNGDDTYLYNQGNGNVWIWSETSGGGEDTLRFDDLSLSDLQLASYEHSSHGQTLKFAWSIGANNGVVQIQETILEHIERFVFADGTILSSIELLESGQLKLHGFAGVDNVILGSVYDDVVNGSDGNDTLSAGQGAGGWQYIAGYGGNDTYLYGKGHGAVLINAHEGEGDGTDTVRFTDLSLSDLRIGTHEYSATSAQGTALKFGWSDGGDSGQLRIANMGQHIERFEFADGTVLENIEVRDDGRLKLFGADKAGGAYIIGSDKDDFIYGTIGADVLSAGRGADDWQHLYGYSGDDTYLYGFGGGNTMISASEGANDGTDIVRFTDLSLSDFTIGTQQYSDSNGLVLKFQWNKNGEQGQLRVAQMGEYIERFEFADGTVLSSIELLEDGHFELIGSSSDNVIIGSAFDETVTGNEGTDTFVFTGTSFGIDKVTDFAAGAGSEDIIRFDANVFADFDAVITAASDDGSDTEIRLDGNNSVTLKGVLVSDLHVDDFQFA
ncbi:calcium-binding protein [Pseudovibrio sp. Ad13]|uniref:calcium-binding protein n=1 Tax=Pseudovibrio sp. Ad13 TaxID=989396 RepID=UPI001FCBBA4C|nr:calcium-binding protein [Pseudovibrio sp. Ad13]